MSVGLGKLLGAGIITGGIMLVSTSVSAANLGRFEFGLWGDMPYAQSGDQARIDALIADINATPTLAFTIFDGDTKDGSSRCDDNIIGANAIAMFNQLQAPLVYVPGDNEWTDCHRINNGSYNPLERLNFLRLNLFNSWQSFGQHTMTLERQGAPGTPYSENSRWTFKGVVFVGLNVPGSNNNKVNAGSCFSKKSLRVEADCDADNAEYADRNAHNLAWLQESFAMARDTGAIGLVLVIQADPWFDLPETEDVNERNDPAFNGYNDLLQTLVTEAAAFTGKIVLVHGDTHFFKIDKPLIDQAHLVRNITRVETFGSPNLHWVKVTVDPTSREVFVFEPMLVEGN